MVSDHSFSVPFVACSDGATEAKTGFEIDAFLETAIAFFVIPTWVHNVAWIRVYARSIVAEADSMKLSLSVFSGKAGEQYNNETISVNKASTSTNFGVDDMIYWEYTSADDADIGHLSGGDICVATAIGAVVDGANCATDAWVYCIQVGVY
jgi:hypothetical protein